MTKAWALFGRQHRLAQRLRSVVRAGSLLGLWLALGSVAAQAAQHRHRHHHARHAHRALAQGPWVPFKAALLEDADTGTILYANNEHVTWPPASMAKMMLLLVAEDQIRSGRFSFNDPVRVSAVAAYTGGSRLGLHVGDVYPLGELMKAALIRSANDAAVAVAEKIAGSTQACVRLMNQRAQSLHMFHTFYGTVDGLPPTPGHDVDFTDAYDLAILAREIIYHTDLLKWSSQESADFDGALILRNTNHLIGRFDGCDGIKTGFTYHAGFNVTATAKRGDMRLIAVILGAPSNPERFRQAAHILEWGFQTYTVAEPVKRGQPLPVQVRVGSGFAVQPIAASGTRVLVPRDDLANINVQYQMPSSINSPVPAGTPLGLVVVRDGTRILGQVPALYPLGVDGAAVALPATSDLRFVSVAPLSGVGAPTTPSASARPIDGAVR